MEPRIVRGRSGPRLQRVDESQANPVVLDPGNSAFADRSVVRHDQAKALGNKRRVLDIDGGALLVRTRRTRTERACGAATGESVDSRNLQ